MSALSGERFVIRAGDEEATVAEIGAGLRRYISRGRDVTFTYGETSCRRSARRACSCRGRTGCATGVYTFDGVDYQLALTEPAQDNAIHGLGRWARWACVLHEPAIGARSRSISRRRPAGRSRSGSRSRYALHADGRTDRDRTGP